MKRKLCLFLSVIIVLLCSCSSTREDGYIDLADKYELNMEAAVEYYRFVFDEKYDYGIEQGKGTGIFGLSKKVYEKCIYFEYSGSRYVVAYEFESSDKAEYYYNVNSSINIPYSFKNNILFVDFIGSYVLLNGTPKYKNGIYYDSEDNDVIIWSDSNITYLYPLKITKISSFAFFNSALHRVELLKLKRIGLGAFAYSENLYEVRLNEGLEYIGFGAFSECPKLKYVVIPSTVTYIGSGAFECEALYCHVEEKPSKWENDFASKDTKVYWKGEWKYSEGIPTPINTEE